MGGRGRGRKGEREGGREGGTGIERQRGRAARQSQRERNRERERQKDKTNHVKSSQGRHVCKQASIRGTTEEPQERERATSVSFDGEKGVCLVEGGSTPLHTCMPWWA